MEAKALLSEAVELRKKWQSKTFQKEKERDSLGDISPVEGEILLFRISLFCVVLCCFV